MLNKMIYMAFDERARGDRSGKNLDAPEVWQLLVNGPVSVFNEMRRRNPYQMIDISDENITGFNLAGIDLHKADLFRTFFRDADLTGADFRGAKLQEARFTNCKLEGAHFDHNEHDAVFEDCSR